MRGSFWAAIPQAQRSFHTSSFTGDSWDSAALSCWVNDHTNVIWSQLCFNQPHSVSHTSSNIKAKEIFLRLNHQEVSRTSVYYRTLFALNFIKTKKERKESNWWSNCCFVEFQQQCCGATKRGQYGLPKSMASSYNPRLEHCDHLTFAWFVIYLDDMQTSLSFFLSSWWCGETLWSSLACTPVLSVHFEWNEDIVVEKWTHLFATSYKQ